MADTVQDMSNMPPPSPALIRRGCVQLGCYLIQRALDRCVPALLVFLWFGLTTAVAGPIPTADYFWWLGIFVAACVVYGIVKAYRHLRRLKTSIVSAWSHGVGIEGSDPIPPEQLDWMEINVSVDDRSFKVYSMRTAPPPEENIP